MAAVMGAWQAFYAPRSSVRWLSPMAGLERARRHAGHIEGSVAAGFLAVAESDHAAAAGRLDDARRLSASDT